MLFYLSKYLKSEIGGDSIFPFLFSGHIFYEFLIKYLKSPSSIVISELYKGTLEYLFNGKIQPYSIPILSSLYKVITDYFILILYILVGVFFLGIEIKFSFLNTLLLHLVFIGGVCLVFGWGLIGASITLWSKKGEPITTGLLYFSILGGGIYFPANILPTVFNIFHYIFPINYWVTLFRELFFRGKFNFTIFIILIVYNIILLIFAINIFNFMVKIVKKKGNLYTY